jgi:hypothetical protein
VGHFAVAAAGGSATQYDHYVGEVDAGRSDCGAVDNHASSTNFFLQTKIIFPYLLSSYDPSYDPLVGEQ